MYFTSTYQTILFIKSERAAFIEREKENYWKKLLWQKRDDIRRTTLYTYNGN